MPGVTLTNTANAPVAINKAANACIIPIMLDMMSSSIFMATLCAQLKLDASLDVSQ